MNYQKVRFTDGKQSTAGLIVKDAGNKTISQLSRMFPDYEAPKMKRLQVSPKFETYEQAFSYEFDEV